jgi:hypothetical protein
MAERQQTAFNHPARDDAVGRAIAIVSRAIHDAMALPIPVWYRTRLAALLHVVQKSDAVAPPLNRNGPLTVKATH